MTRPSVRPHNRQHISPRQIRILQTLWSSRLRRTRQRLRPERSREERLRLISETLGREVKSSKELSWREANRVIQRLLEEVGPQRPEMGTEPVDSTPDAAAALPSTTAIAAPDAPSPAQLWKIRQIAQYLGWTPPGGQETRLARFLRAKFHVEQPEQLTHDQAWRAIEALCAAGARARLKARKGKAYAVRHEELTREIAALKEELQEWRPA